jgi:hypothetical protein
MFKYPPALLLHRCFNDNKVIPIPHLLKNAFSLDIRVVYYYSNSYMRLKFIYICLLACLDVSLAALNMSICTDIQISDLHYYINSNSNNHDIVTINGSEISTYNLCKEVEVHCPS